jgi:hypothetical protein
MELFRKVATITEDLWD